MKVFHTKPADATFSTSGASAWDAEHGLSISTDDVKFHSNNLTSPVADVLDDILSAGWIGGGAVTEVSTGVVDVAAGIGLFRTMDDASSPIRYDSWDKLTGQTIPTDTERFIYVAYNG